MTERPEMITLTFDALNALLARIFAANGCSDEVATILADNCARAEMARSYSHGLFRIDGYVSTLRSGWVEGRAEPRVHETAPGALFVDAANGFAQPALAAARPEFVRRIRASGIAFLAIRDSHHFGALWPDVTPFAEEGLIAISMVNSFACSIPAGARAPLLGTNPLAFAAPVEEAAPFVFDFATTSMANGDVQIAARERRDVPPGTGVDASGNPTCDPRAILDGGSLIPFGGHKGSAVSLMIEIMVAGLTGGQFSAEVDWSNHPGAQTPRTGQVFIGIDPAHAGQGGFATRAADFMRQLSEAGFETYPGYRRWQERQNDTLSLSGADLALLKDYAAGRI